jgi:uncharacterized protein YjbI with pentapeptide repeats
MGDGDEAAPGDEPPAEDSSKKYDQDFFLDLAAKGKDAWNAWRRDPANKDVRVTFAGVDFRETPRDEIGFSGFEFGDNANFSGCKWQRVYFDEASFGHDANFSGATFDYRVYFRATTFGHFAEFSNATFGDELANFAGATFGDGTLFGSGSFVGESAIFRGARFASFVDFSGATFNPMASFEGAIFRRPTDFSGLSEALFTEKLERILGPTHETTARKELEERHRNSWKWHGCRPDCFLTISFARAHFDGEADFSGRTFERTADFTNARFYSLPKFDAVTNASQIDFTGAYIGFVPASRVHWTNDSRVVIRLRTLRKIAEETKNHDLERDLYIEERKAGRGVYLCQRFLDLKKEPWKNWPRNAARLVGHALWIIVMFFYGVLSNYGRSFARPVTWLVVSVFIFYSGYASILSPLRQKAEPANKDYYDQAVWMLALSNAVPFVGHLSIDAGHKKSLYCPNHDCGGRSPIPPLCVQVLVIVQNVVSIALIFFFGLALRNYFKIK